MAHFRYLRSTNTTGKDLHAAFQQGGTEFVLVATFWCWYLIEVILFSSFVYFYILFNVCVTFRFDNLNADADDEKENYDVSRPFTLRLYFNS